MADYLTTQKQQILNTFEDYSVVLVEIFCKQPEWNGRIVAISQNCGCFTSINSAIAAGIFEANSTASFGVTAKCLDIMENIEKSQPKNETNTMPKINQEFVEEKFGCLLSLFIGFIAFILWCIFSAF